MKNVLLFRKLDLLRSLNRLFSSSVIDTCMIRNVGVIAHIDAGKTTTTERMINLCGLTRFVGDVDTGNTVTDFMDQERERGITIKAASVSLDWNKGKINLIDTPGHVDFTMEVERSLKVLDGAIVVVDCVEGVQAQTLTVWRQAAKNKLSSIGFINKLDREGSDFSYAVNSLSNRLGVSVLCIQMPIGSGNDYIGCVDLVSMKLLVWGSDVLQNSKSASNKVSHLPIALKLSQYPLTSSFPPILRQIMTEQIMKDAEHAREVMIERLADMDDEFMSKYVSSIDSGVELSRDEIQTSIRRLTLENKIFPILAGSSLRGRGIEPLMDAVISYLPSPQDKQHLNLTRHFLAPTLTEPGAKSKKYSKEPIHDDLPSKIDLNDMTDFCGQVFKVVVDADRGPIAFLRVYSGSLSSRQTIMNTSKGKKERVHQLLHIHASDYDLIESVSVGNIAGIVGLKHTATGDTLVADGIGLDSYSLPSIHIPDPVYMVTVEPENLLKQQELDAALKNLCLEDPSLQIDVDSEKSSTIIKGMGELHIDVVVEKLKRDYGVELDIGKVSVAFRNGIRKSARERIVFDRVIGDKRLYADIEARIEHTSDDCPVVVALDDAILSSADFDDDVKECVLDALESSSLHGPLGGYPLVGCKIVVLRINQQHGNITTGSARAAISMLVPKLVMASNPVLLEPIMKLEISVPTDHVGQVLNDLCVNRRANINQVDVTSHGANSNNNCQIIDADAPFERILGYSVILRSITAGEASCTIEYSKYGEVDESRAKIIIGR